MPTVHTNNSDHRVMMLKMGYSLEDIRQAHVDEMNGCVVFIEVNWCTKSLKPK